LAEVFLLGIWKNFDEIEESLNVFEINAIRDAARKRDHERRKFEAMLHKGVDLDEGSNDGTPTFEDIKRRAEARNRGVSEEQLEFADIGIQIIEE
jgi:hypothetical protein